MNTIPLLPWPDELTDELLSADLDGELAAAAADLGLDGSVIRSTIDLSDELLARRQRLAEAAAAMRGAETDLGELERRRLVHSVLGHTSVVGAKPAARQPLRIIGALATAAAVITVAFILVASPGDRSQRSAKGVATTAPSRALAERAVVPVPDLGPVTSAAQLAQRLQGHGAGANALSSSSTSIATRPGNTVTLTPPSSQLSSPRNVDATPAQRCLAKLPAAAGAIGLTVVATASFQGHPVAVATGRVGADTRIWAFRISDCATVLSISHV